MPRQTTKANDRRPATHQEDPLLTLTQAGDMMGVTHTTIKSWIMTGVLQGVMLPGGRLRVRQSSVDYWLARPAGGIETLTTAEAEKLEGA